MTFFCFLLYKFDEFKHGVPTFSDEQMKLKDEWRKKVFE